MDLWKLKIYTDIEFTSVSWIFSHVYILELQKYMKKPTTHSKNVRVDAVFRTWCWRMGAMVRILQEKQAPKIADKLLKEKITCNSSHVKATRTNTLGACMCALEKCTPSCKMNVQSQGVRCMELSPIGSLLRHFQTKYQEVWCGKKQYLAYRSI